MRLVWLKMRAVIETALRKCPQTLHRTCVTERSLRVLQKLLMQSTQPTLWQRRRKISQSILNRFTCNFAHTIRSHCGDCPENLVRFDRVFQKLLMWCTETTLFPHRQTCGPSLKQHWGSALPPSYMCDWAVRTDKAGRQDWESNYQHYIDIGPISFFFFFFLRYDT